MNYLIPIAIAAVICAVLVALVWRHDPASERRDRDGAPAPDPAIRERAAHTTAVLAAPAQARDPGLAVLAAPAQARDPGLDDPAPALAAQPPGDSPSPRSEAPLSAPALPPAPPEGPCSAAPPLPDSSPLSILVVEDNRLNEDLVIRMLARLGYCADVAHDGLEALEAVQSQHYDVVLMDIHMPRLDGLAASRRIRAEMPPARQPRIIAITANALSGDRAMCLAAGMDDYLSKPVSTQMLQRALRGEPAAEVPAAPLAPPQAAALPTWNPGPLARLAESLGPTASVLLRALVGSFFDEANQMLPQLAGCLAAGDMVTLHRYAHTLKSHGATFGGQAFESLCRELERAAAAGDLERATGLIPRVEDEFERLRVALELALPSEG